MGSKYLEPIHGISLKDYTAMVKKIMGGADSESVYTAIGIDGTIWDEVNTLWMQRMTEDPNFEVVTLYGQYFGEDLPHAKLDALEAKQSSQGAENLERLKTDRYFYEELTGARDAAYQYGLDGAQWILENFGINLADFQSVAMKYMEIRNGESSEETLAYLEYNNEKQEEYAERFAAERGGNVSDDVEF